MARAYYPEGNKYKPWSADMVGASQLLTFPSDAVTKMYLGKFVASTTTNGQSFTLNLHTNFGYNGAVEQAQEVTLRFAFGNGSNILQVGWASYFPANNPAIIFYYRVEGTTVHVYYDSTTYPGNNTTYSVHCSEYNKWTHIGENISSIPSDATEFTQVGVINTVDSEVVVSSSQPTNNNAKIWVKI